MDKEAPAQHTTDTSSSVLGMQLIFSLFVQLSFFEISSIQIRCHFAVPDKATSSWRATAAVTGRRPAAVATLPGHADAAGQSSIPELFGPAAAVVVVVVAAAAAAASETKERDTKETEQLQLLLSLLLLYRLLLSEQIE